MALQQPKRGEVEDAVGAIERRLQDVGLENITAHVEDLDALVLERLGQIFLPTANEIVVDENFGDLASCQLIDGVRADEASAADDDDFLIIELHVRIGLRPIIYRGLGVVGRSIWGKDG